MKNSNVAIGLLMLALEVQLSCRMQQPGPDPDPEPTDFTEFLHDILDDDENGEPVDITDDVAFVFEENNTVFDDVIED
jgi:hypothetical protein